MNSMIQTIDLTKKFGDFTANDHINLDVKEQEIKCIVGENGAGKTTLMRLICGILQPTNGSITCDNIRISDMGAEYRQLLGYLPQNFGYYGDFTAVRFLNYMAALKALPRDYAKGR